MSLKNILVFIIAFALGLYFESISKSAKVEYLGKKIVCLKNLQEKKLRNKIAKPSSVGKKIKKKETIEELK